MPREHNGRLLVLACSARKATALGRIPAYERYQGPLWQTLRAADPDASKATVTFLSARLGFRSAQAPIEAYDARLTPSLAERMIEGGITARWSAQPFSHGRASSASHAASQIASLTHYGDCPFHDVALAGGHLYLAVMRRFLEEFKTRGHITSDARVVEINGPIGLMRQNLRAWLDQSHSPAAEAHGCSSLEAAPAPAIESGPSR